jgi:hypothetical protein
MKRIGFMQEHIMRKIVSFILIAAFIIVVPVVFAAEKPKISGVVIGQAVRNDKGTTLGIVENVIINKNGCVQYLVLSGKFSGAGDRLYPVPLSMVNVSGPEYFVINIEPEILAQAPNLTKNDLRKFTLSAWEARITNFYNTRAQFSPGPDGRQLSGTSVPERSVKDTNKKKEKSPAGFHKSESPKFKSDEKSKVNDGDKEASVNEGKVEKSNEDLPAKPEEQSKPKLQRRVFKSGRDFGKPAGKSPDIGVRSDAPNSGKGKPSRLRENRSGAEESYVSNRQPGIGQAELDQNLSGSAVKEKLPGGEKRTNELKGALRSPTKSGKGDL